MPSAVRVDWRVSRQAPGSWPFRLLDHFGDIAGQIVSCAKIAAEEANVPLHRAIEHDVAVPGNKLTLHT